MLSFGSLFRVPIIPHGHRYHRNLSKTALTLTFLPWLVLPTPVSHAYSPRYTPKPAQPFTPGSCFPTWRTSGGVNPNRNDSDSFIPTCLSFALANASLRVGLAMPRPGSPPFPHCLLCRRCRRAQPEQDCLADPRMSCVHQTVTPRLSQPIPTTTF